ncbi:protein-glutamate methylesterase/protein-glutamine glutaminase [Pseudaestuariivita rosea]|uniref:protein-glutamate methylesterase/protein-glutamine glutaminase n=1 Tax=Pseudaestuariivita rosea TaxID=2763263 RepID=UPI001ABA852E|nr:chemotaxis response regulator protein-glutamate methylesterase [Pseudaestuariivita rosea]
MKPVSVLIVDDSATARKIIRANLEKDGRFMIAGEAASAHEARAAIKTLNPDVLTLDVEMPVMSGLEFLKRLMRLRPMPVMMVSSQTEKGSQRALEALSLGAVDCIGKPKSIAGNELKSLADRLYTVAHAKTHTSSVSMRVESSSSWKWNGKIVLLGASTGGVGAIEAILAGMPARCPPILIAQHMPEGFLRSFATRLDRMFQPRVKIAEHNEKLTPGHLYLAPGGGMDLQVQGRNALMCSLQPGQPEDMYSPSVDVLFKSGVQLGSKVVGVVLTGMGRDGAEGMLQLRQANAYTVAQDEQTSVVYGMPRAAVEDGAVVQSAPIDKIADLILSRTNALERGAAQ